MTPETLIGTAVDLGIDKDPRGRRALEAKLKSRKERFRDLPRADQSRYDVASLSNPFGDTRLVVNGQGVEIESLLIGIDIGPEEVFLGDKLKKKDGTSPMIISHHASALGKALASVWDTIDVQIHMMKEAGVSSEEADRVTRELEAVKEKNRIQGNPRIIQRAEAADIPLASIHAPADLYAHAHIMDKVTEFEPTTVAEFLEVVGQVKEFQGLPDKRRVPRLTLGSTRAPFQPAYFSLIGGWNPLASGIEVLAQAGIQTLVMIECHAELSRMARKHGMNVVLLPHYPYDSLGLNLLLDEVMSVTGESFQIFACSNYLRLERNNRGEGETWK